MTVVAQDPCSGKDVFARNAVSNSSPLPLSWHGSRLHGVRRILQLGGLVFGTLLLVASTYNEDLKAQEPIQPADVAAAPVNPPNAVQPDAKKLPSNLLVWTYVSLGPLYTIIFLMLSIALVALVVGNTLTLLRSNMAPPELMEGVEQSLGEGNAQAAAELIRSDESFVGKILTAGLGKLERGYDHAIEAMQIVGEEETMKIEHRLSYMAVIGNVAPMIGLLGTVQGMIAAFSVIAQSTSTPKPSELAEGISTALFTTLVGLIIAIPAIAIYNFMRNRLQRFVLESGNTSEDMIEKFERTVRT